MHFGESNVHIHSHSPKCTYVIFPSNVSTIDLWVLSTYGWSGVGWKNYVSAFWREQRAHSFTLTKMHLRNFSIQRQYYRPMGTLDLWVIWRWMEKLRKCILESNVHIHSHSPKCAYVIFPSNVSSLDLCVRAKLPFYKLASQNNRSSNNLGNIRKTSLL